MVTNLSRTLEGVEGIVIQQRTADGFVNVTQLCKAHIQKTGERKDASEWFETEMSKAALSTLAERLNVPTTSLYERKPGRNGGTWIHPRVAVRFAMWLDNDFSLQVEDWVHDWMTTAQNPIQMTFSELNHLEMMLDAVLQALKLIHTATHNAHFLLNTARTQLQEIRSSQAVRMLDAESHRKYTAKLESVNNKIGELSNELSKFDIPVDALNEFGGFSSLE